jgi:hypothetical protein
MVIAPLTCSLVEKTDAIELRNNTLIAKAYGKPKLKKGITATISPEFAQELESGDMRVTGWDEQGEIRAAELVTHPFFVITLFQHERAALDGRPVVLAQAMLRAARVKKADLRSALCLAGRDFPIAPGKHAASGHHDGGERTGHQRNSPVARRIVNFPHQRWAAGCQQITNRLCHPGQCRSLVRRAGAQADKRQAEDHRGA